MDVNVARLLNDLYNITGARISLHDIDLKEIAAYPQNALPFCTELQKNPEVLKQCLIADKAAFKQVKKTGEIYIYKCHCGLTEIAAPIYHYGVLSGYLMMGQITGTENDAVENIISACKKYYGNLSELRQIAGKIPKTENTLLKSQVNIITVIASYLTELHAIRPKKEDLATEIKQYINMNYDKNISIEKLCVKFACSRATLMNSFKAKHGTTILSFLNELRINKSAELLLSSEKSVKAIAAECGYHDQNYFAKVFKGVYGKTPSQYREGFLK